MPLGKRKFELARKLRFCETELATLYIQIIDLEKRVSLLRKQWDSKSKQS